MNNILSEGGKNVSGILPAESIIGNLKQKRIFVVHRHLGSILHYDLRIEINGVLKNWAIPKGPSMNADDRRLAILTDDLPLSYADFKGIVPEGNYGAGILEGWDRGYIVPHSAQHSSCDDRDMLCQLNEGRLRFSLKGRKLKGVFSLVRMSAGSPHWILIKGNDKFAVAHPYNSDSFIPSNSMINRYMRSHGETMSYFS